MRKEDVMRILEETLAPLDERTRREMMENYEEHFAEGLEQGRSEEEICEELGDVREIAEELLSMVQETKADQEPVKTKEESSDLSSIPQKPEENKGPEGTGKPGAGDFLREGGKIDLLKGGISLEAGDFEELQVTGVWADIQVKSGAGERARIFFANRGRNPADKGWMLVCSLSSGKLAVQMKNANSVLSTGFALNGTIVAELPLKVFRSVSLDTLSGDVRADIVKADQLTAVSKSGDCVLGSIQGKTVSAKSTSGDVKIDTVFAENIAAGSVSGDVKLSGSEADFVKAGTVSGDTEVSGVYSELDGSVVSGDFTLENKKACRMSISSVSGDIKLFPAAGISGNVHTTSGDILLETAGLANGVGLEFKSVSGSVSDRSGKASVIKSGPRMYRVVAGRGESRIEAGSVSGDLKLR